MNDQDVEVEQIRQLYLKFEGLTGSQEADALLLLALVLKEALDTKKLDDLQEQYGNLVEAHEDAVHRFVAAEERVVELEASLVALIEKLKPREEGAE
jgi:hypothetical protein